MTVRAYTQDGDVRAGGDQEQSDEDQGQSSKVLVGLAADRQGQRVGNDAEPTCRHLLRRLRGRQQPDRRELGLGGLLGDARCEPGKREDRRSLLVWVVGLRCRERGPELVVHREGETLRHDPDHGVVHTAKPHLLPHHRRVRSKPRLPRVIADHHDGDGAGVFVVLDQGPPQQWRYARQLEPGCRHHGDSHRFAGRAVGGAQVALDRAECADSLHRGQRRTPSFEVEMGWLLPAGRRRILHHQGHHAVTVVQWQGAAELDLDDAERACGNGDQDRHGQASHQREAPRFPQHAHAQLDV